MIAVVETLNAWSKAWVGLMGAVVWQLTVIAAGVALVAFLLRRSSPALRYWLWQLVAIKLLVMPFWVVAVPMPWSVADPASEGAIDFDFPGTTGLDGEDLALDLPLGATEPLEDGSPKPVETPWWKRLASVSGLDRLTWQSWLLAAWLAVLVWQVLRVILQRVRLACLLRQAAPVTDPFLLSLRDELADQLKLARLPKIVAAEFDGSPFVCGVRRPVLVLPAEVADQLDLEQFRQVLAHELAHVRRRDLLWGWITEAARMIYFFHPVAHWASYRVRLERELACDQIAMHLSGFDPARYAATLVQIASRASQPSVLKVPAATSVGLNGAGTAGQRTPPSQKEPQS